MNKILDIDSEEDRAAAIAVLAKAPLPLVIEVRVGEKRRSLSQNAAYRSLIGDIATLTGHERSELHRHFGRRLLDFEADTVGGLEALVPRSTRSLSHAEMGELIENVQCIAAWLGMDPVSADAENWDGGDVEGSGNETKDQALSCALTQIYNAFGDEALMSMDGEAVGNVDTVSTGSIGLDLALGVGGLARGRLHELYGGESSGKTTLALHAIARVQKQGGTAAFIDAEHALDLNYAVRLGVDIDQLLVSQPDDGEQALDITDTLVRCGAVDIIVVDSVAALTPRAEIAGEMGAAQSGLQARLMSQALRRLTANVKRSNSVVLFLNQTRARIGSAYANPGGHALKFYATSRIEISRTAAIKEGGAVVGNTTKVKVVKNKLSPPFRQAEFDLLYGDGVSREGELIDLGLQAAVVAKSGGWYNYDGQPLGQRKENARRFLKERPEIAEEIASSIEAAHGSGQATRTTKQEIAHRGAGSLREVNAA